MKSKSVGSLAPSKNTEKETWSKCIRKGDTSVDIRVEELDNKGCLVIIEKSWKDKKGDHHYDVKKYYSETNPLDEEPSDPFDDLAKSILKL